MNIGENILLQRKKLNMSQEDLGNLIYVSRQTISMWEKGQTVPTLDNLIRLGEVFSVTVDEILYGEKEANTESDGTVPNEKYSFQFTAEELKKVYNINGTLINILKVMLPAIIFLLWALNSESVFLKGLMVGVFLILSASQIKYFRDYKKGIKDIAPKILSTTYNYEVFDDYYNLTLIKDGEIRKQFKFRFEDIQNILELDNFLVLTVDNMIFYIKKSDLKGNSIFYSFSFNNPAKVTKPGIPFKWSLSSDLLFIASLFSVAFAAFLQGTANESNGLLTENMWLFFTVTPIPVASLIFGIVAKCKGYKFKNNIVIGIILTVLLCIYGCFCFIFPSTEELEKLQQEAFEKYGFETQTNTKYKYVVEYDYIFN